jgi:hypothetical protein
MWLGCTEGQAIQRGKHFLLTNVEKWTSVGCALPKTTWGPCATCSRKVGPFWGLMDLLFVLGAILVTKDTIIGSTLCFLVCGVDQVSLVENGHFTTSPCN